MNIALIGYRGSGKSTVGRHLAALLKLDFVDTDALLVSRGQTIKAIFETEGEAGFRDRESAIIREVTMRDGVVIAAGGGAILRPENVAALKARCQIIWLKASPADLHARIQADAATNLSRPDLTSAGGLAEIESLLAVRTPAYRAAADFQIEIVPLPPKEVALHISRLISKNC